MVIPPAIDALLPSLVRSGTTVTCSIEDMQRLLYVALTFFTVDEEWYCQQYPDVKTAIAEKKIASATDHYRQTGYWEGRLPFRAEVDDQWYLKQYPDVLKAIERGQVKDARSHYLGSGYKEGRLARPVTVDQQWYQHAYPKARLRLQRGDSTNPSDDFLRYGYREGLVPFRPSAGRSSVET